MNITTTTGLGKSLLLTGLGLGLCISAAQALDAPPVRMTGKATAPDGEMSWWYREPAQKFWEGLPLGTGRFGAMVYGQIRDETIVFNDQTLWTGSPYNPVNPKGLGALPEIRKSVLEGRYAKAMQLCDQNLFSYPYAHVQNYQAMGRLHLQFAGHDEVADYRRELDMDSAMARVQYRIGDALYQREIFASHPDQVVVIRLTCDKRGRLNLKVRFDSIQPSATSRAEHDDELVMDGGTIQEGGIPNLMKWQSRVKVITRGGTVRRSEMASGNDKTRACLAIQDADEVLLILAGATNFKRWNDISADPSERCEKYLACASRSYAELRRRHLEDYQPRFRACRLDLGKTDAAKEDTTTRLRAKTADDPLFIAQYFQYGRYLMLAAAREGSLAFNNHNIWLDDLIGRWRGRWTLNINIQECYWPVENTSLPELNESLLLFVQYLSESGRRTARELYGCRGWCAHHGTDVWMNTTPTDSARFGMTPNMGAWLCLQLWQHYLFEPDTHYLRRIYPLLKGAAEFGLDISIEEPKHKWLVTCPSASPENEFRGPDGQTSTVSMGSTMDNQLLRDLFGDCIEASRTLGVDETWRAELEKAVQRLPPEQIGKHGQLQEWLYDFDEPEPTHRHLSHLIGFYPSCQITRRGTPELAGAVRKVLERRGDSGPGWSKAWKINLWARLGEGDHAARLLEQLIKQTSHEADESDRVPSMEGNQGIQGITAGIAEMLMQSHASEIELLPALPKTWSSGSVQGLRARGGFRVDMAWDQNNVKQASITSKIGGPCRIRCSTPLTVEADGKPIPTTVIEPQVFSFDTQPGKTYLFARAQTR
jgi:alpha-L-fucosidase 2